MNFDYTFITLFGFTIYEPMVIVTNSVFFILCAYYFKQLRSFSHPYAQQMSWFVFLLGISSCFGALGHAVHYQLGEIFFKIILFLMNAFSLFSIYFCFRAPYTYVHLDKALPKKYIYLTLAWVIVVLIASVIVGDFVIIKIHAALVLMYALITHYLVYKRTDDAGSALVVSGIGISFLPIIVHSLKFSINEWFNYKDIAHVIMIFSLIVIYKGARLNAIKLNAKSVTA